jgi:CubicO group peptidase (beta-lactamase class C family)
LPKKRIAFITHSRHSCPVKALAFLFATATLGFPAFALAQTQSVPASVRVTFDAKNILTQQETGLADRTAERRVTLDDPVRIASLSKLFVALGVMRLVDQGKIDLDRNVSDYLGWPLHNPAFPDRPITLRLLLSHQSSITDDADYLIPATQNVRAKMADPKIWDAKHAPGSGWFRYTNLNFPIIASVMENVSGERFDTLIGRLVLKPLKLDACFNWAGCSDDRKARAVILYRASGEVARDSVEDRTPPCAGIHPAESLCNKLGWNGGLFSPQGGLRISARDLAKTGQMLLRGGKGFLKPKSFAQLTAPAWRYDGSNGDSEGGFFCAYGLAVQTIGRGGTGCKDQPFSDDHIRIGHAGEAYGLKSGLWIDRKNGTGIAFFTTAIPDDTPRGQSAFYAVEEAILQQR